MLHLPKFRAAAVQAAPVFFDSDATIDKACALIAEAARNGASLVAFPEVYVSAYPYWSWVMNPVDASPFFERLCRSAIEVPGPEVRRLQECAREHAVHVVIGINERASYSIATIYNTLLTIDAEGRLLGRHRKLVPTFAEKLTWANGDASSLKVHKTAIGPLGALACGENTNTLARFALLAQGELVHVASYIGLPVTPADYDMAEAIRIRATAHSFEGKIFTVVSSSTLSEEIVETVSKAQPSARPLFERKSFAFSGIIGPDGRVVGQPLIDDEGIAYADIDLSSCIQPRQTHDIIGHYNRFDIFDFKVNRRPQGPARFEDDAMVPEGVGELPAKAPVEDRDAKTLM
ncbi:carbon-nitrogen hydrolase family protein [Methylobacterium brachiatum]